MIIVWDEPKRLANIAKHGIDFADIGPDFSGIIFLLFDLDKGKICFLKIKKNIPIFLIKIFLNI